MTNVILVDQNDTMIWQKEKLTAHQDADLHRAFSVYVFDEQGRVVLQQRALHKYHSPGKRANTCCSHQLLLDDGTQEDNNVAAHRRLGEEMWFDCPLQKVTEFVYRVPVPPELVEHEYLHVFVGKYEGQAIIPNPEEVCDYRWVESDELIELCRHADPKIATRTQHTRNLCGPQLIQAAKDLFGKER